MLYAIRSLCQITEISSNMYCTVNRFEYTVSMKAVSSVDIPFLKLYCSVTSMLFVFRCWLNLLCIALSQVPQKTPLIMRQPCNLSYRFCLLSCKVILLG